MKSTRPFQTQKHEHAHEKALERLGEDGQALNTRQSTGGAFVELTFAGKLYSESSGSSAAAA